MVDRRGWVELGALFLATAAAATLITNQLAAAGENRAIPSGTSLVFSICVAAIVGLGAVAGTIWSWRRNGGRPAQRLGRHSWHTGKLPDSIAERTLALRDLQRRQQLLQRRFPQIIVTVVWVFLTAAQLWINHSIPSIIVWTLLFSCILFSGIRDTIDRRHLPRLDALLNSDESHQLTPVPTN